MEYLNPISTTQTVKIIYPDGTTKKGMVTRTANSNFDKFVEIIDTQGRVGVFRYEYKDGDAWYPSFLRSTSRAPDPLIGKAVNGSVRIRFGAASTPVGEDKGSSIAQPNGTWLQIPPKYAVGNLLQLGDTAFSPIYRVRTVSPQGTPITVSPLSGATPSEWLNLVYYGDGMWYRESTDPRSHFIVRRFG